MKELKIQKIQNKEEVEVLSQNAANCSTKENHYGYLFGCEEDCLVDGKKTPYVVEYY